MTRVAILIDGDNISAAHAQRIAALGQKQGRVDVHRAYLNASNGSGWNTLPGVKLIDAGSGKNAADLLLSIDAMEFALTGWFDTFVLASADRDFTHLAIRLREHGSAVIGAGDVRAPKDFRSACTRFVELQSPNSGNGPTGARPKVAVQLSELDKTICALIGKSDPDGRNMNLSELGKQLKNNHAIDRQALPTASLKQYLKSRPDLYHLHPYQEPSQVRLTSATTRC